MSLVIAVVHAVPEDSTKVVDYSGAQLWSLKHADFLADRNKWLEAGKSFHFQCMFFWQTICE